MAGNPQGRGEASKAEGGLDKAMDRAWEDLKNHGGQPDHPYPVHIQVMGNNPIHTYIVIIGGP
jgi:hypothetical protein